MENFQVDITGEQRKMLLRGLRYVRSSVKLDMRLPSEDTAAQRQAELDTIERLMARLDSANSVTTADC